MYTIPSEQLIQDMEHAELRYMVDRMLAIQEREHNPEGIEIQRFGQAVALYSQTMPWPSFNTVKGIAIAIWSGSG